ncbi:tetratricopeptide repeat protein [Sphingobium boeckii]|uniref:TPR repeat protein n=1 Tax=Sphingobium boeckii TaxID=1082345 RepID=A0A7W9ALW0_9SPHN|nr:SEL1-like repeat protein [Sphingobium boeckii]MBB5687852.1 TPR repeat protein [Sphingobium boeckii]
MRSAKWLLLIIAFASSILPFGWVACAQVNLSAISRDEWLRAETETFLRKTDAFNWDYADLEGLADSGDVRAMVVFAYIHMNPKSLHVQSEHAHIYLSKAVGLGDIRAMAVQGADLLYSADPEVADPLRGFSLLKRAVENGAIFGKAHLGLAYLMGKGTQKDSVLGQRLIDEAVGAGSANGLYLQGWLQWGGLGGPADLSRAFEFVGQAAELSHPQAMAEFSRMLISAEFGQEGREAEAALLARNSAFMRNPAGEYMYGYFLESCRGGIASNKEQALQWYTRA